MRVVYGIAILSIIIFLFDTTKLNNYFFFINPDASSIETSYSLATNWSNINLQTNQLLGTELDIRFNPYPILTYIFKILNTDFTLIIIYHILLNIFTVYLFVQVIKTANLSKALCVSSLTLMSIMQILYFSFDLGLNSSLLADTTFMRIVDHFKFMTGAADWYAASIGLEPRNSIAILISVLIISTSRKVSKFYYFFVILVHPVSFLILLCYSFLGSLFTLNFDIKRIKIYVSSALFFLGVTNFYWNDYSFPLFFEIIFIVISIFFFKADSTNNAQNDLFRLGPNIIPIFLFPVIYVIFFENINSIFLTEIYQRTIFISRFIFYYVVLYFIASGFSLLRAQYFCKSKRFH
jgi:hypothetical protein